MLAVSFAVAGPLHLFAPARAKAHVNTGPVQVGISFSPRRTDALGLDYQVAFKRLEAYPPTGVRSIRTGTTGSTG